MAIAKKQTGSKTSAGDKNRKNSSSKSWWRTFLFVVLMLVAAAICATFAYLLLRLSSQPMENPRFVLRNIEVRNVAGSAGYWVKHGKELADTIKISAGGEMKMFALKPEEIRKKLLEVPSIEVGNVRFILPDTLVLEVAERIPRASLPEEGPFKVVDRYGEEMDVRKTITGSAAKLPKILGVRGGEEKLQSALDLIMLVLNSYPDITIEIISVAHKYKDCLVVVLKFRNQPNKYKVYFPTDGESFDYLLISLQNAILEASKNGDYRRTFDLRNKDQIAIRNEEMSI